MDIQAAFEHLAQAHGSHSGAAAAIGFTRDHYRALRNGRASIPQRTAEYILLKAAEVEGVCDLNPDLQATTPASISAPPAPQDSPHAEPPA